MMRLGFSIQSKFRFHVALIAITILIMQLICIYLQFRVIFEDEKNITKNITVTIEDYFIQKISNLKSAQQHNVFRNSVREFLISERDNTGSNAEMLKVTSYLREFGDKGMNVFLFDNNKAVYSFPLETKKTVNELKKIYEEYLETGQKFFVVRLTDYVNDYYLVSIEPVTQHNIHNVEIINLGASVVVVPINVIKMKNDIYFPKGSKMHIDNLITKEEVFNIDFDEETANKIASNFEQRKQLSDIPYELVVSLNFNLLQSDLFIISILMIFEVILLLLLLASFSRTISRELIIPIKKIKEYLGEWKITSRAQTLDVDGCAEVYDITTSINEMATKNKQLMREVFSMQEKLYERELVEKQTRLDFLTLQINPHFLYNTLNCIKAIASEYDVPDIEMIVISLANILRYSLNFSKSATVGEELDALKSYCQIHQIRTMNQIEVEYDLPEEMYKFEIIKFVFQPIVENSIKHGFRRKGKHRLTVQGKLEDGIMVFSIIDNGCGISPQKLEEIQKSLSDNANGRVVL